MPISSGAGSRFTNSSCSAFNGGYWAANWSMTTMSGGSFFDVFVD